jgi:hypothetical protein
VPPGDGDAWGTNRLTPAPSPQNANDWSFPFAPKGQTRRRHAPPPLALGTGWRKDLPPSVLETSPLPHDGGRVLSTPGSGRWLRPPAAGRCHCPSTHPPLQGRPRRCRRRCLRVPPLPPLPLSRQCPRCPRLSLASPAYRTASSSCPPTPSSVPHSRYGSPPSRPRSSAAAPGVS